MKTIQIFYFSLFLLISSSVYSQNTEHIKVINTHVWANFTKAFETSNYKLFASLHSDSLVRVSGNQSSIRKKDEYISGYKRNWENNSVSQTISFRFLERIANNEMASERGIYKYTRNPNTDEEQSFYGKFHVILRGESNVWKILVDYDSSENNTINEESYNSAYAIDDFEKY